MSPFPQIRPTHPCTLSLQRCVCVCALTPLTRNFSETDVFCSPIQTKTEADLSPSHWLWLLLMNRKVLIIHFLRWDKGCGLIQKQKGCGEVSNAVTQKQVTIFIHVSMHFHPFKTKNVIIYCQKALRLPPCGKNVVPQVECCSLRMKSKPAFRQCCKPTFNYQNMIKKYHRVNRKVRI